MQQEEIIQVLNDPLAQELMHSNTPARLAYTGVDGFPRAIPIGFFWNGTQLIMCTATNSPKMKALQANPNVALTIDTAVPTWAKILDFETRVPRAQEEMREAQASK